LCFSLKYTSPEIEAKNHFSKFKGSKQNKKPSKSNKKQFKLKKTGTTRNKRRMDG